MNDLSDRSGRGAASRRAAVGRGCRGGRIAALWGVCALWLTLAGPTPSTAQGVFFEGPIPDDAGFINLKDHGAAGDGKTDDTAVFQAILGAGKHHPHPELGAARAVYIPDGTYLISDTIAWGDKKKEVRGESRDGVVIKLRDHAPGFDDPTQPRRVLSTEFGFGPQNFDQRIYNLTIDVGAGNTGAVGLGFGTANHGGVWNVRITSSDPEHAGHTGLRIEQKWPGPGTISGVTIEGFDTGVFVRHDNASMTFEHLTLRDQRRVGFVNQNNTVAIRKLRSDNAVTAVENRGGTALMALVESQLRGGDAADPAIRNHDGAVLYARDVRTAGYAAAIDDAGRADGDGPPTRTHLDEYATHGPTTLFDDTPSFTLPVEDPPRFDPGDPAGWVNVKRYQQLKDGEDWGPAIQAALDSGAATVYLPRGRYPVHRSLRVPGRVRHVLGFRAQTIFQIPDRPGWVIADGQHPLLLDVAGGYGSEAAISVLHDSTRTLVYRGGSYRNSVPGGKVFIFDTVAVPLHFDRQRVWARQINPESYQHPSMIVNDGGDLWVLGLKTEKDRTVLTTRGGGRSEVLGGFLYKNAQKHPEQAPAFIVEDASLKAVYRNKQNAYQPQVLETRGGQTRALTIDDLPAPAWRADWFLANPAPSSAKAAPAPTEP